MEITKPSVCTQNGVNADANFGKGGQRPFFRTGGPEAKRLSPGAGSRSVLPAPEAGGRSEGEGGQKRSACLPTPLATGGSRSRSRSYRAGFTLVELLVVIAIIGMLMGLLLPAVQQVREAARRLQCANNMHQLAIGMHGYAAMNGGFPPGTYSWRGDDSPKRDGYPAYDDFSWLPLLGPHLEQMAWFDMMKFDHSFSNPVNEEARRMKIPTFACPSDMGLVENEWDNSTWARVRGNYVANWGNTNYGQKTKEGQVFLGSPLRPIERTVSDSITDGTSNTLLLSETKVIPPTGTAWGGPISDHMTSLGGQTFSGWYPPNSSHGDICARQVVENHYYLENAIPIPTLTAVSGDGVYTARSHHIGGVNVARCDGSGQFISNGIYLNTWRALTSAAGEEIFSYDF
ncbi:MAG: DUF1559 domain-containing protein [Planctomycetia bacterium]|nr:DUF1559 domain-containing protein [Planctomycetia bacterium]